MPQAAPPSLADGRYILVRRLGEGGMATVLLAWDTKLKVWRAIKSLLPSFVRKRKVRTRFENEAHAMARLEHPHVLRVYDVGQEGDLPYMVMEYAQGGCIIDWLGIHGPMPPALACEVTIQVAQGLQVAHDAGIVHRDVKPHNVLVNHKGVCKVTDFGIAQLTDDVSLTKTGSVMGTWGYMAPEQRADAKAVDARADVFGLGATLYTLLTNRTPTELYVAEEGDGTFDGVPEVLLPIIRTACAYRPEQRQPDVLAVAEQLREALLSLPEPPVDTPSLVLPHDALPTSIESLTIGDDTVIELREALGLDGTEADSPSLFGADKPLPYFLDPTDEPGTPTAPTPDQAPMDVDALLDALPSYVAFDEPATADDAHLDGGLGFPSAPEPDAPPLVQFDTPPPAPAARATPEPAPPAAPAPQEAPAGVGPIGLALRAAVLVVVLLFALVAAVLGWGMVDVASAEGEVVRAARPLDGAIDVDVQGPIIDALGLAGADAAALEALLRAHTRSGAPDDAAAYADAVLAAAEAHAEHPQIQPMLDHLRPLRDARDAYHDARASWTDRSEGFPGSLAVALGLAHHPPPTSSP